MPKHKSNEVELLKTWVLPPSATLGSGVRAKGILFEARARLPTPVKKLLDLDGTDLTLAMPASATGEFRAATAVVSDLLQHCETLPVIPREIEDILTIKTSERHRWLSDGRLPSAGTRTVRLNGRARRITFHVFDPKVVEDILDRGLVEDWREEDAISKAENRRKAAYAAKLTRSLKALGKAEKARGGAGNISADADEQAAALRGWAEFDIDGLLR